MHNWLHPRIQSPKHLFDATLGAASMLYKLYTRSSTHMPHTVQHLLHPAGCAVSLPRHSPWSVRDTQQLCLTHYAAHHPCPSNSECDDPKHPPSACLPPLVQ